MLIILFLYHIICYIQYMKIYRICILRFFLIVGLINTIIWIRLTITKYNNIQHNNIILSNSTNINISNTIQGILIISPTPHITAQQLNRQILSVQEASTCIYIWIPNNNNIQQRINFINKIPNYHKIMSQIIFMDDIIDGHSLNRKDLQQSSIHINNIDYIYLDMNQQQSIIQSIQQLIQKSWLYQQQYIKHINTNIYRKQNILQQYKLAIHCTEQFNKLLHKTGVRQNKNKNNINRQLVISPQIKSISVMNNYVQLTKHISYLLNWMHINNNTHKIIIPQLNNKQQQSTMTNIILVLKQYKQDIHIMVSHKNKQFIKNIQRNVILNDLSVTVVKYDRSFRQVINDGLLQVLILNTLDMFVQLLDTYRNKIIKQGLSVAVYIQNNEQIPQNIYNQFLVRHLNHKYFQNTKQQQVDGTKNNEAGIYIISRHQKPIQVQKIIKQRMVGSYGYQFVVQDKNQQLTPRWIKQNIKQSSNNIKPCLQDYPQIKQYFLFNTAPYKQLIQSMHNNSNNMNNIKQITILWCLSDMVQLFFGIITSKFVQRIGFCSIFNEQTKKKLIKIAVLNDLIGKVIFKTQITYDYLIINQQFKSKSNLQGLTFNYSLIKNQQTDCLNKIQQFCMINNKT